MDIYYYLAAALSGGIVSILSGYLLAHEQTQEEWDSEKALKSLLAVGSFSVIIGWTLAEAGVTWSWAVGVPTFLSAIAVNFWGKDVWDILKLYWEKMPAP